jgi:hypothetical protein
MTEQFAAGANRFGGFRNAKKHPVDRWQFNTLELKSALKRKHNARMP